MFKYYVTQGMGRRGEEREEERKKGGGGLSKQKYKKLKIPPSPRESS